MANGINEPPPAKKVAVDRLPEFDWAANNYELTWKLVEQLRKEEHKKVVFPEHEIPRVGACQMYTYDVSLNPLLEPSWGHQRGCLSTHSSDHRV